MRRTKIYVFAASLRDSCYVCALLQSAFRLSVLRSYYGSVDFPERRFLDVVKNNRSGGFDESSCALQDC